MARRAALHTQVQSRRAHRPLGHAAQGVVAQPGALLCVGAQLPLELPSGKLSQAPFGRQVGLALGHLQAVVTDAGFTMDHVVEVTCYVTASLADGALLKALDEAYRTFFISQSIPARTLVQVAGLPMGSALAVACRAVKPAAAAPQAAAADDDFDEGDDY